MIEVKNVTDQTGSYWMVSNDTGNNKPEIFSYLKDDPIGYDKIRCLRMIVDFYTACGYRGSWKKEGEIFTLDKPK